MRIHALALALLLAAGCATREASAPEPAPLSTEAAREARIEQAAALELEGHALAAQKHPEQAIAVLQRSIALNPGDPETHGVLGTVLLEAGRFALAARSFERAHALTPDDPRVDAGLGTAYHKMGRYQAAKAPLLRASRAFPDDYPILLQLGRVGFATKDFRLCAESFQKFTRSVEQRDPALVPKPLAEDYQRALAFVELCEGKPR